MGRFRSFLSRARDIAINLYDREPVKSIRRKLRAAERRIEDHAGPLVFGAWLLLISTIGILLLWKTAKVISLAKDFQPVLAVIAIITSAALAVLKWLKRGRDRTPDDEPGLPPEPLNPPIPPPNTDGPLADPLGRIQHDERASSGERP
ncbi:hypothetical protein [Nonomuraea sp. NPDC049709]|uniref:hypothetical protein n=1 Tax=Nonomuraea sp. NPDC049709 TaxID=3154736 RepID=UPI003446F038